MKGFLWTGLHSSRHPLLKLPAVEVAQGKLQVQEAQLPQR